MDELTRDVLIAQHQRDLRLEAAERRRARLVPATRPPFQHPARHDLRACPAVRNACTGSVAH